MYSVNSHVNLKVIHYRKLESNPYSCICVQKFLHIPVELNKSVSAIVQAEFRELHAIEEISRTLLFKICLLFKLVK